MYESPMNIIYGQMEIKMENDILSAIQHYGIDVNKDALISALTYDRNQYDKGFKDGEMSSVERLTELISRLDEEYALLSNHPLKLSEYCEGFNYVLENVKAVLNEDNLRLISEKDER